jgi:spore maturation protein CgeB
MTINQSKKTKVILYVGSLEPGGTSLQRMQAMIDLGHEVVPVNGRLDFHNKGLPIIHRIMYKIGVPIDSTKVNHRIRHLIKERVFDLLWIDKGLTVTPRTLKIVREISPKTLIAGYSPDDMTVRNNNSLFFLRGLIFYHVYFTTKSFGVRELEELGAARAIFIGNAYDPKTHRQMAVSPEVRRNFGGPVGFIGAYERERAESLFFLAQHGLPVRVWGPNWKEKCKHSQPNLKIEGKCLWGEDYARGICSFDINLGFLRKINRDLQTTRSIEIPACSAFMLAERTNEHLDLFEEGKEAEFFETNKELLEKVRYYLSHEQERQRIAQAGRERCIRSGYSNHERLKEMLMRINGIHNLN